MSKRLIFCTGLPGSGKSAYAAAMVEESFTSDMVPHGSVIIVNKDAIRKELEATGWVWSHENEHDVIKIRDERIVEALRSRDDITVISDDTNFGRKHKVRLEQLARENGAKFEIKSFLDVPIETCIERDSRREGKAKVGAEVIKGMAERYLKTGESFEIRPYTIPDHECMPAILCDLDGTLSLFEKKGHRGPYDASRCDEDEINEPVRKVIEVFYRFMQYQILYLSGREERFRPQTDTWRRNNHIPPGPLYMRSNGDYRKDYIIKGELFDKYVRNQYNVVFALDDRDQVVDFYRSIGLTVFQVADGAF